MKEKQNKLIKRFVKYIWCFLWNQLDSKITQGGTCQWIYIMVALGEKCFLKPYEKNM